MGYPLKELNGKEKIQGALPWVILLILAVGGLTNCAKARTPKKATQSTLVKQCILPDDQAGTLSGRWKKLPVPIAVKTGNFDDAEINEIQAAVKTWNQFYGASLNLTVLDSGAEKIRDVSKEKPTTLCSEGILQGNEFTGQVVIYKHAQWPYPNTEAIALTSFCPISAQPLPNIYMAIMEFNYQHFFVEGTKLPDLQTIFLHEFGHLLGLDHSCNTQSKNGYPLCSDPAMSKDYYQAVMFPIIPFTAGGQGEQRRELQSNDQGRANCLYQDMPSASPSSSPSPSAS